MATPPGWPTPSTAALLPQHTLPHRRSQHVNDPVFVIHGVANHSRDEFTTTVSSLSAAVGLDMIPVHWGDLGAQDQFIDATLPTHQTVPETLRTREASHPSSVQPLAARALPEPVNREEQLSQIDTAIRAHLDAEKDAEHDGLR